MRLRSKPMFDLERVEGTWLLSAVPVRLAIFGLLLSAVFPSLSRAQAPVFEVIPLQSSIKFDVEASIDIKGKFDKWNANLTFTSPDETTGVLESLEHPSFRQET